MFTFWVVSGFIGILILRTSFPQYFTFFDNYSNPTVIASCLVLSVICGGFILLGAIYSVLFNR